MKNYEQAETSPGTELLEVLERKFSDAYLLDMDGADSITVDWEMVGAGESIVLEPVQTERPDFYVLSRDKVGDCPVTLLERDIGQEKLEVKFMINQLVRTGEVFAPVVETRGANVEDVGALHVGSDGRVYSTSYRRFLEDDEKQEVIEALERCDIVNTRLPWIRSMNDVLGEEYKFEI